MILFVTGPNMGGKSTYLRQNMLICWLAQVGLFVPANLTTCIFDSFFIRIGCADNLSAGESTFMNEMLECAEILRNCTKNSLIMLDEIGRGTSLKEGAALAQAIIEYTQDIGAKVMVSSHDSSLKLDHLNIRYCKMGVYVSDGEVHFTYKLEEGKALNSFALVVAKKAKIPSSIISRASELLNLYN